jgi:hypothetical protein
MVVTNVCRSMRGCILGMPAASALPESAGGRVPVLRAPWDVAEDRSGVAAVSGSIDRAGDRRRWWDQHGFVFLAADLEYAVAVFLAEVADVRAAGFEGPQAEETEHGDQGEVVDVRRHRAVLINASNCKWPRPSVGDSAGAGARRT